MLDVWRGGAKLFCQMMVGEDRGKVINRFVEAYSPLVDRSASKCQVSKGSRSEVEERSRY